MFNYNDIIEYIDCTYDENFEDAKHWCNENNAQLIELIEKREVKDDLLYRYFRIEENIESPINKPSEKDLIIQEINNYKQFLFNTDYVIIKIMEGVSTKEEYEDIIEERQNVRNYINELETRLEE